MVSKTQTKQPEVDIATRTKSERKQKAGGEDIDMVDAQQEDSATATTAATTTTTTPGAQEPSFGDLIQAQKEAIDVEDTLAAEEEEEEGGARTRKDGGPRHKPSSSTANTPTAGKNGGAASTGLSLTSVLTQALKTNDSSLLESCFHTPDMKIVRSTIQRLDSSLASTLLKRLAERLSNRSGRYGSLNAWVQWTCVVHGGSLAGEPEVMKQLTGLFKVMEQRSSSLSSLLLLKGKLDLLDAQLGLRKELQRQSQHKKATNDEDEEGVIYVEGMEDDEEEPRKAVNGISDGESDGDDDMALLNETGSDASDSEESEEEEEDSDEDLVDDEAEVSDEGVEVGNDSAEDEDEDEDDEGDDEADEEDIAFIDDSEAPSRKKKTRK